MDKIKQGLYYIVVGVVSFISLVFLPMIGSTIGLGWNIPDTTVGWIVWVGSKIIVATLNVLIFHCFMCQAKINIKDNENYLKAREILMDVKLKEVKPRSPRKWNAEQYGKKGVTIFITSSMAVVALTQAVLSFDYISMLTYLFAIIMGLIFGILQMKTAEEYWTREYLEYALYRQELALKQQQQQITQSGDATTSTSESTACALYTQQISEDNDSDNNRQQAIQESRRASQEELG